MRADRRALLLCCLVFGSLAALLELSALFGTTTPASGALRRQVSVADDEATPAATAVPTSAPPTPTPHVQTNDVTDDRGNDTPPVAAAVTAPGETGGAAEDAESATTREAPAAAPPSILDDNQVIVYYGSPLGLGVLGALAPDQAASAVADRAIRYDELNGDLGAVGALDVIYSLAMDEPTDNGLYVRYLPDEIIQGYLDLAEKRNLQVILDLQIGRGTILDEVRRIEPFLLNPRVHVAIDPEYAVGPDGVPVATPGRISGEEINEVKDYLRDLVKAHNLPPKMFVLHQYMDDTVIDGDNIEATDDVDFVLNMDGWGDIKDKKEKYKFFSNKRYAQHKAFNVFLVHDETVMSEEDVMGLSPVPRVVFYQ